MSTLTEPHTNGHDRELGGVRTYRGRKLEDLIPQIRAELGPDAIILRQREGLMGGVGGFFAQKCVEVDAQAGAAGRHLRRGRARQRLGADRRRGVLASGPAGASGPREEPVTPAPVAAPEAFVPTPVAPAPPVPEAFVPAPVPEACPAPAPAPAPEAPIAPAPQDAIPAPPAATPPAEGAAESFVTRLEQAAAHVDIEELVKLVTTGGLPRRPKSTTRPSAVVPEAPAPAPAPVAAEPVPAPAPDAPARPRRPSPSLRPPLPRPRAAPRRRSPRPLRPAIPAPPRRSPGRAGPAGRQPLGRQAGRSARLGRGRGVAAGADLPGHQRRLGARADRRRRRAPLAAREGQPA